MIPYAIFFTVVVCLFLWLLYDAVGQLIKSQESGRKLEEENTLLRSLLNRTVQVVMTDVQIEQIAIIVSNRLKEPKQWAN